MSRPATATRFPLVPLTLALCVAFATLDTPTAQAQTPAPAAALAAGPLADTLNQLARQHGVAITADPALVQGRRAPALPAGLSLHQALELALRDNALQAVTTATGTITLAPRPGANSTTLLAPVTVQAGLLGATTEGSGSYTTGSTNSATRLPLTLRETPQSVTVVTRQQMDDQSMNTLEDAVVSATGLTMRRSGSNRVSFYSRGFSVSSISYDGLPSSLENLQFDVFASADLAIYDRVEMVRGATGLVQGAGNPSATINLVRKRPTDTFQAHVLGHVGSWNNRRIEGDISSPLNESGTVRGRVVAAYEDKDSFMRRIDETKHVFYGVVEADLSPTTLLTASVNVQDSDRTSSWVLPPYGMARDANPAPDWHRHDTLNQTYSVKLEQQLAEDWKVTFNATRQRGRMHFVGATYSGVPDYATGDGLRMTSPAYYLYESRQTAIDVHAAGPLTLFGRRHEVSVGADFRKDSLVPWYAAPRNPQTMPFNLYHGDPGADLPEPDFGPMVRQTWGSSSRQSSVYAAARWNLRDDLKLITGARLSYWRSLDDQGAVIYQVRNEVTPYAGIVYDLHPQHSVYASYTSIFKPQNAYDRDGKLLDPVTGESYEMGFKSEFFDARLNSSVALFRTEQINRSQSDFDGPSPCPYTGADFCSRAAGKVRSEGVDIDLNGQITESLQVAAGYTYNRAHYVRDAVNQGKAFDTRSPRHLFKLGVSYQVTPDWTLGAFAYAQSGIYNEGTNAAGPWKLRQKPYAVFDLSASWQVTRQLGLRLKVGNVFDRVYYQSLGSPTGSNLYGTPRNVLLTARYDF